MKLKKLNHFIILLIFSLISFDISASTYCLSRNHSLFSVKKDLKSLLIQGEDVLIDTKSNCLELAVKPYREGLVSKYINMNYQVDRHMTKAVNIPVAMCKFKLKKTDIENKESKKVELGKNINISNSSGSEKKERIQDIIVMENRSAIISINNQSLYLKCKKNVDTFTIDISLNEDFTTMLSTVITIAAGEWFNIASIKNDLNERNKNISIQSGIELTKQIDDQKIDYLMKVE